MRSYNSRFNPVLILKAPETKKKLIRVNPNETIWLFSIRVFGTPDKWQDIADLNNLTDIFLLPEFLEVPLA